MSDSSIWPIDSSTIPSQSILGSSGNAGVLHIPQHYWSLTIRWRGLTAFGEMQFVYSPAPTDCALLGILYSGKHLTGSKRIINVKIFIITWQYSKGFICVQKNEIFMIEVWVLDSNTIEDYLMSNPFIHIYILNVYDLVWVGFMAYQQLQIIKCQILYIYIYIYIYIYDFVWFGLVWFGFMVYQPL